MQSTQVNSLKKALFWFRRDLRLYDNRGLSYALNNFHNVYCVFVFDRNILDQLPNKQDRRVEFIWRSLEELKHNLIAHGGDLIIVDGFPTNIIPQLAQQLSVDAVVTNHDYEPYARQRDKAIEENLQVSNIKLFTFKDHAVFEKEEVLTAQKKPYTVFTPYKNNWLKQLSAEHYSLEEVDFSHLAKSNLINYVIPTLTDLGFMSTNLTELKIIAGESGARNLLKEFIPRMPYYHERRDFPGIRGVSYLSVHSRFGTISVRELVRQALQLNNQGSASWLNELIWRDFYFSILWHFPHVTKGAFKKEWDKLMFENNPTWFTAWCTGNTGYPIIDAAMRQLIQTGFMHNRLRMISASFLVKDLQIDWRWGESFFSVHLNDFDLSANNGGWQWSASTGCDAQPWFRIFNPIAQSEKFDSEGSFIKRYCPELKSIPSTKIHSPWLLSEFEQQQYHCLIGIDYPAPIVDHKIAREKTLALYKMI
ncbi:MAG: deoxyribodipyrimidine photolyase [Ferrovum sp. 37-45-19]|nr:MAG: deoxyribodipyrimidine photolyase [Ferrovum sp. 21-44-67]OYV94638.1 MAG: deoxyribodipyrimidine photolyase [Ferrovum sp. 37-45-19]OZB34537.1 MAG: deoxyribodipyrimidine photolyase [Ferrovum sp. 34-44-207]HQT81486.1 deoxyribodipyrimidine photo-lyase [Ferrovaceae bacterium]HQU06373.1 deoxyribodipyrimidine photo-lyase [Ferrovaceae bacterium]